MTADKRESSPSSMTQEWRNAVSAQLERMLATSLFTQSKRYSPFLRYVVEKTLAGGGDTLKERTLGIEVFGRVPDYDSNLDPVVRVTASEVRRRIAQYYHEPGHEEELRIELSPGSYVPEFIGPRRIPVGAPVAGLFPRVAAPEVTLLTQTSARNARNLLGIAAVGITVLGLVGAMVHWHAQKSSMLGQWWAPVLHSATPVLLSVGTIPNTTLTASEQTQTTSALDNQTVGGDLIAADHVDLVDAVALEKFAALLATHDQPYRTLPASATTYGDMRSAPVVLIAGLDNVWTMRVTEPLRFRFQVRPNSEISFIADQQHPDNMDWSVDFAMPYSQLTRDYGIIARLHDATSDRPVFVVAGIGRNGTAAAVEYVTSESTLKSLIGQLPPHWEDKNIEAVVQARVINGQAGPPTLVQLQVW